MSSLTNLFREKIAQHLFPGNNFPEIQYWCWQYRFSPSNYHLKHKDIANKITDKVGYFNEEGINSTIKEVIKKIYSAFQKELEQDGVTKEQIGLSKKDQQNSSKREGISHHHPWKVVYYWLWERKYDRWLQKYIWDSWKQKAVFNKEWISFSNQEKGMVIAKPQQTPSLPINQALQMEISIDFPEKYLLLLNRGRDNQNQETRYLVCPSQAFAPNWQLLEPITLMPQPGAMCQDIQFDAPAQEEYIGILLDEKFDLPWLNPDPANPAWKWEGKDLGKVWEKLQENNGWQVFYQCFEVS